MSDFLSRVEAILSGVMNFNPKSRVERLLMKWVGSVGNVEDLETEDKSSIVAAINEVNSSGGGGYEPPAGGIPKTDLASAVQTSLGKADSALQASALNPYRTASAQDVIDATKAAASDVSAIQAKIPSAATSANQLADKAFVNSTVSTNTAIFRGTFNSVAELEAYSGDKTNNDYAFVITTDSTENTVYNRYKYNGTAWVFEYALNNSSFTAAQWAAIQSGITSGDVELIRTALQPADLTDYALKTDLDEYAKTEDVPTQLAQLTSDSTHRVVTDAEKSTWNGKSDVVISSVDDITPTEVATAISQGKTVVITAFGVDSGSLSFEAWNVATDFHLVISNTTARPFGVWATISLQGNLLTDSWDLVSDGIATREDLDSKVDKTALELTDKKLRYLAELTKGQAWDVEQGTSPAYQQSVPSGAKAVAIDSIGGKSVVFNQLVENGNFTNANLWTLNNSQFSVSENIGIWTVDNINEIASLSKNFCWQKAVVGHKYYFHMCIKSIGVNYSQGAYVAQYRFDVRANADEWTSVDFISPPATDNLNNLIYIYYKPGNLHQEVHIKNAMCIDLTLMFGAGNEPSTVEEFEAMFPDDYYAYDTGGLMSANVVSVDSKDSNAVSLGSFLIPQELRISYPLHSAGSVYDEYDFKYKKFVQRVGARAYQSGDESDTSVITDGTTTYYALAVPTETDISAYLSDDNLLTAEGGGTLTFEQNDTTLPIPNKMEYAVNLSEAV